MPKLAEHCHQLSPMESGVIHHMQDHFVAGHDTLATANKLEVN